MKFEIFGEIDSIKTIAQGNGIRALALSRTRHGVGNWQKKKGIVQVKLPDSSIALAEARRQGECQDNGVTMSFGVCTTREGYRDLSTDGLTLGRLYEVQVPVDDYGMIRVVDDSGEEYLYPRDFFEAVEVQQQTAKERVRNNFPRSW